ncbi:hypothetical protein APS56_00770 [Pseudalgibacter alginicilyticus]|uniref:Secretion system C-terminal sorting domain-containing protein n=1 Tax=Pseudalgibacter alginicilyticus TaxID=1736674 RepID=A0A0P0CZS9_9FLAO|nr:T9SS type A sorting domain-containing protein [Pseudalgibacter alginicilyticus]ALJ03770.1 hypothetical protein APS56_00770 [Pseudalgibacter alginicilyticus]
MLGGNDLYIAVSTGKKISKIDITDPIPTTATEFISGFTGRPYGLLLHGNDLYVSEFSSGDLSKIDIAAPSPTLTTVSLSLIVSMYPNPADGYVKTLGVTEAVNFKIFNVLGVEIFSGKISDSQQIDTKILTQGIYYLELENIKTMRFIKKK